MTETTCLLLGSGEFEPWVAETELKVLGGSSGDGSVLVAPTASASEGDEVFERWANMGLDHYAGMGVPAEVLDVRRRDDAMRQELAARAESASMVFFSGGKPQYLASVFEDTPVWSAIGRALARGGVYAGCSAGAMVASQSKTQGAARGSLGAGWLFGLGLVPNVSFGVHWDRLRYVPGMRPLMMSRLTPGVCFVGIDERTAIVGGGGRWEVHGRAGVMVRHHGSTTTYRAGETFTTLDVDPREGAS